MGWDFWNWGDDKKPKPAPKPSPLEKAREGWSNGPSPEILRRHGAQPQLPQPGQKTTGTTPVLATWSDPTKATRATQRYLHAAGWNGAPLATLSSNTTGVDETTLQDIGVHSYRLTPWQQEQAALEYGVKASKDSPELRGDAHNTGKMKAADFEALNDKQRNAVKFNQLLLNAVESDRKNAVAPEEQDPEYQNRVNEMFGTQGGSNVYAPRTMDLLDKMGLGKLRGQDLDEYLSLDRAYDVDEIGALQSWDATPEAPEYQDFAQARTVEVAGKLDQLQVDYAGSLIEKALADTATTGWNEEARISNYLGTRPAVEAIPFGWLLEGEDRGNDPDNKKEALFQNMYDFLSTNTTENLDEFWAETEARKFTEADYSEIYDYFYLRSMEDDRKGTPEGYRSGQETRDFIGIGG